MGQPPTDDKEKESKLMTSIVHEKRQSPFIVWQPFGNLPQNTSNSVQLMLWKQIEIRIDGEDKLFSP